MMQIDVLKYNLHRLFNEFETNWPSEANLYCIELCVLLFFLFFSFSFVEQLKKSLA